MFKVILGEDDKEIRQLYSKVLRNSEFEVLEVKNGLEVINLSEMMKVDIIITDIMMPVMDGNELLRNLKEMNSNIPVLMITAKNSFYDMQQGFVNGADDYMVKPINVNDMILRVQALLRRAQLVFSNKLTLGSTKLDYNSFAAKVNGNEIELTQKEFKLLFKLLSECGHAFTRLQIMDDVWEGDCFTDPHTVDVHIARLRNKFDSCSDFEIITIRGMGYKAVKKIE